MNVQNRTLFIADNLDIMRGIDSNTIDLIYLDPPFNTKKNYKAPIGTPAEGASFKDIWTDEDVKDGWYSVVAEDYPYIHQVIQAAQHTYDHSMMIYLMAMSIRLFEMHRLLTDKGSIYLHCDPTASHYLKLIMDAIYGKNNFRNEIVWHYQAGTKPKTAFGHKHDIVIWYSKSRKWTHNRQGQPVQNPERYTETDENGRKYLWGGNWDKTLKRGTKKYYLDDGKACDDVWTWLSEPEFNSLNSQSKERTGYPTQKPLALLERIIKASSNENDVILDPFCGCATACVAAEKLRRQWIGIDISPAAEVITKLRLDRASEQGELFSPIQMSDVTVTSDPPIRTDPPEARQIKLPNYQVHKNDLYGKQSGNCNGCKRHFEIQNFSVDHILPVSSGGTDHPANLQLLCNHCNSVKSTGTQEQLIDRLKAEGILT